MCVFSSIMMCSISIFRQRGDGRKWSGGDKQLHGKLSNVILPTLFVLYMVSLY